MTVHKPDVNLAISPAEMVQIGRSALHIEAASIATFADNMGPEYVRAVELLSQKRGQTIVTGIGKSGHIARKIASTFSSVGCQAFFVHPSEASHGDLGMIAPGDRLLALSNSGETSELSDIIAYCEGLGIPIVAIVGNGKSTLARRARVALAYGEVREVCTNGLAPTTSTTLALAIGDALAVGIMTVMGTTIENFHRFHPGGRLGAALLKVEDIMHSGDQLPLVRPDMFMKEVVVVMSAKGFGVAIVQDEEGHVTGLITDGDMRRHVDVLWNLRAKDLLSMRPVTVPPTTLASHALEIMTERGITSLLVGDEGADPIGLLHIHDCLRAGL
jgi:arabinose-5-phosphate isomerase